MLLITSSKNNFVYWIYKTKTQFEVYLHSEVLSSMSSVSTSRSEPSLCSESSFRTISNINRKISDISVTFPFKRSPNITIKSEELIDDLLCASTLNINWLNSLCHSSISLGRSCTIQSSKRCSHEKLLCYGALPT